MQLLIPDGKGNGNNVERGTLVEPSSRKEMTFQMRENTNRNLLKASYREGKMGAEQSIQQQLCCLYICYSWWCSLHAFPSAKK